MSGWHSILAAARVENTAFKRAWAAPRASQWKLLHDILQTNAETAFGLRHGFGTIDSFEAFRARVPIRTYDQLRPWLERVAAGEPSALTREPVIAFEETGGSRSGGKLIPYTSSSLRGFRAAVLPWLAELEARRPAAFAGKAYVSISPAARQPRSIGGIPVGLPNEGAYLGPELVAAFTDVLAVPPSLAELTNVDEWRSATLAHLLNAADLTIISVWSPTFMIALLDAIPHLAEVLLATIHDGALGVGANPPRAREVDAALAQCPIDTERLWPRLDTVSAWADGVSRRYANRLAQMLPHACLQPKGLLATESAVTTPCSAFWPVPALTSAFLEFIDEAGRPHLSDELQAGESYRVVLTSPGGLYRYDLGDRLRCHGFDGPSPLLEFVGREVASDLVGEKLHEDLISEVLSAIDCAACLAPRAAATPFYELLVDAGHGGDRQPMAALVDRLLCANPQYAYARRIGQLGPVALRRLDRLIERHTRAQALRGRRLADIKPPVLVDDVRTYEAMTNQVDNESSDLRTSSLVA
jgi:hypothetical protein